MPKSFQQRLEHCMQVGNLSIADLSRWFGRPHSTVRCWVCDGYEPGGGPQDIAIVRSELARLETLIARRDGKFPVPRLPPGERIAYLKAIK
jgi:hypothetical protein